MADKDPIDGLTEAELEALVAGSDPVDSLSEAELTKLASGKSVKPTTPPRPAGPSLGDIAGAVGSKVMGGMVSAFTPAINAVSAPFEELGKVTGAPPRAAVGALQRGEGLSGAGDAFVDQLQAGLPSIDSSGITAGEILPSTPTDDDIAMTGMLASGAPPASAQSLLPIAGLLTGAGLDLGNAIPSGAIRAGAKGALKGAAALERATVRGIGHVGNRFTNGAIDAGKALKMFQELKAGEMVMPGMKHYGLMKAQGETLGAMRKAFQETPITLPGSHDAAQQIVDMIEKVGDRGFRTPGAKRLLKKLKGNMFTTELVEVPARVELVPGPMGQPVQQMIPAGVEEQLVKRDLTIDEMDDAVQLFDDVAFTPKGNSKAMPAVWGPTISQARRIADEALQSVPEGQLFKSEKARYEALAIAGKERGALVEAIDDAATVNAVITKNPLALITKVLVPGTFVNLVAAVKVPREIAQTMLLAHKTGRMGAIRDAITAMAEKYPAATERLMRAVVLASHKPEGRQFLTQEELDTLAANRSFDPAEIAAERQRIDSDRSMSSVEKYKKLNAINQNGYVILADDQAPVEPLSETPQQKVFGGDAGLKNVIQSLQRSGG